MDGAVYIDVVFLERSAGLSGSILKSPSNGQKKSIYPSILISFLNGLKFQMHMISPHESESTIDQPD
jgi:hypothetical protein